MTSRQRRTAASSSPTFSSRRRDISITSVKLGSSAGWQPRAAAVFSGLSFDTARKNYLPLGALSPAVESKPMTKGNRQSIGRSVTTYQNPMAIPFIPSPQISTSIPIPVTVTRTNDDNKVGRKIVPNQLSTPKPIPVFMSRSFDSEARDERKIASRTLVKILPQKLKPGYNVRRNSTLYKRRPQISGVQLKNWPNEALQNVQDLLNYEKYTNFMDEDIEDKNKVTLVEKSKIQMNSREPSNKSPEIQPPVRWSKIPIVEAEVSSNPNDRIDVDSTMEIDSLLDDLGKDRIAPFPQTQVSQNTVVHILNAGSKKPNVTVVEQPMSAVASKVNKTKTASTRPPQNVHIMFMVDKDESQAGNQTAAEQLPPTEFLGTDSDCPTIMINSITQINNTIESKAGCTDLNIVINSHVLNTNIFKPTGQTIPAGTGTPGVKDPYGSSPGTPPSNYPSYSPPNNYYQNNNNYYNGGKDPAGQVQSDDVGNPGLNEPQISTFEVFQGTHINVGGISQTAEDVPADEDSPGSDDSTGNDADGSALTDPEEGTNDITGTGPETNNPSDDVVSDGGASATGEEVTPQAAAAEASTEVGQALNPISSDIGTGQASGSPPANLPSLPSVPNLPGGSQLTNLPGSSGGAADDDDEDDLIEALSPVNLLDSISSVFNYFNPLNPINYGIFGMAVAPFVAFAAGVVGVAAFLFPWAFPGSLNFARGWDDSSKVRIRFNPSLRDVVHSSIHKYRHLNEWKGRRRKRKRKR